MLNTRSVRVMPTLVVLLAYASICSAQTDSTGMTPLIDFQPGELYQGVCEGGLYPGAANTPPAGHLASAMAMAAEIVPRNAVGDPDPNGVIVMLSIGFSIKWLIEEQIDGDASLNFDPTQGAVRAPLLLWGPYLWADGIIPRSDGLVWLPEDFEQDGVHPAATAEQKVADLLSAFFASDGTTQSWFPSQGNGFLVSIDADADAFVRSAAPTENLGSDPTLRARGGASEETAFMRFDASPVQGEILWAKLSLRLPTQSQAPEQAVSLVTDTTWQESTITFSNAPLINGGVLASFLSSSRDSTLAADVTQAIASDGDGQLSFAITSTVSQPSSFSSKESGQPPRLIVAVASRDQPAVPTVSQWSFLVMVCCLSRNWTFPDPGLVCPGKGNDHEERTQEVHRRGKDGDSAAALGGEDAGGCYTSRGHILRFL